MADGIEVTGTWIERRYSSRRLRLGKHGSGGMMSLHCSSFWECGEEESSRARSYLISFIVQRYEGRTLTRPMKCSIQSINSIISNIPFHPLPTPIPVVILKESIKSSLNDDRIWAKADIYPNLHFPSFSGKMGGL